MTSWTHIADSHSIIEPATPTAPNATTGTLSASIQAGDLLVALCTSATDGIAAQSGLALSDTGSGGWQQIGSPVNAGSGAVATAGVLQWKVATALDASASLTLTATPPTTGAGSLWYVGWLVSAWRPPVGTVATLDLAASVSGLTSSLTTLSVSPSTGSIEPGFTDELAVTGLIGRAHGSPTGTNTFTGTSGTTSLGSSASLSSSGSGFVGTNQGVGGVEASATAGSNTFTNTWGLASNSVALFGATFYYYHPVPGAVGDFTPSVQVAFNDNVWAASPTWTDITRYVTKVTTTMGRQHELQQVNPSTAIIELMNQPVSTADPGGRFSPWNTASPYYNSGAGLTPGHPVRVRATVGGHTYNVFYGYTQSWVPRYGQSSSSVTLNCYDGMALLNLALMDQSLYPAQVLADGAVAYWECQDPTGSHTFADSTGNGNTGTLHSGEFGLAPGALLATPDSCVSLLLGGMFTSVVPASQTSVMFEGWFNTTSANDQIIGAWQVNPSSPPTVQPGVVLALLGHTGFGQAQIFGQNTSGATTRLITGTTALNDGAWHHYAVTVPVTDATGTYKLYVDGLLVGSSTSSGFNWHTGGGNTALGFLVGSWFYNFSLASPVSGTDFTGTMDQLAYYTTPLSGSQILNHYKIGKAGFGVEDSGTRTATVLEALAGVPSGLINADTGVVQVQGATSSLTQQTVSSYLQQVVNTERGMLYQDTSGVLQFKNRWHVYTNSTSVNSQFTFTYDGTGQYFYSTGLVPGEDDTDLWNDINVGRQGGTIQNVVSSSSITKYGRRALQGYTSLLFEYDSDALDLAQGLLSQYKNPMPRVRAIQTSSTINNGAALPDVLALNLLDRITIVWRPIDGSSANFSQQSLVEQIQHTITPAQWDTTLAVTPIGTEVYALWDSGLWDSGEWGF